MTCCRRLMLSISLAFLFFFSPLGHAAKSAAKNTKPMPSVFACHSRVAFHQPHQRGITFLLNRLNAMIEVTAPRGPGISLQQFWIIAVVSEFAEFGVNIDQLPGELNSRGLGKAFGIGFDRDGLKNATDAMVQSRLLDVDYREELPRFFPTADGIWEALNLAAFHRNVFNTAVETHYEKGTRLTLRNIRDAYGDDDYTFSGLLGATQVAIAANLPTTHFYNAWDIFCETVFNGDYGTPTSISSGYGAMHSMVEKGLILDPQKSFAKISWTSEYRARPPRRSVETTRIKLTPLGQRELFRTLYFALRSEDMVIKRNPPSGQPTSVLGHFLGEFRSRAAQ